VIIRYTKETGAGENIARSEVEFDGSLDELSQFAMTAHNAKELWRAMFGGDAGDLFSAFKGVFGL
jgi:hypothetical protein